MHFARRFQVNFRIHPVKEFQILENITNTIIYPVFWFEELASSTHSEDKVISRIRL